MRTVRLLLFGIAVGAAVAYFYFRATRPIGIADIVSEHYATVTIVAAGPTAATITVHRRDDAPSSLNIVVPAGTVLLNRTPNSQHLVTATTIFFTITTSSPNQAKMVDLYCLDEFALPPTKGMELALSTAGTAGTGTDETDPIRKLIDCMSGIQDIPPAYKQNTLWLVAGNYLNQSKTAARQALTEKLRPTAVSQVAHAFDDGDALQYAAEQLRKEHPELELTPERVARAVAAYQSARSAAHAEAAIEALVDKELADFFSHAPQILDKCGYNTQQLQLFQ